MRGRVVMAAVVALQCTTRDGAPPSGTTSTPPPASDACPAAIAPIVVRECFEDRRFAGRGWYDNTEPQLTEAEHPPEGKSAMVYAWKKGESKPAGGNAMRHTFPPSEAVYVSYMVKYSDNWIGSAKPYHPHEFYIMSSKDGEYDGPSYNWLTLYIEQSFDHGGRPRLALQDSKSINISLGALPLSLLTLTDDRSVGGCNGIPELDFIVECYDAPPWTNNKQLLGPVVFKEAKGAGYLGNWNKVEVFFQLNSIANGEARADGVMQYWFNGAMILDRHDILFRTARRADLKMNQFLVAPYMGDGSPVDQSMYIDDLVIATSRPGSP